MLFYPELPGLGYSVLKTPKFYNSVQSHVSGRVVRVAYAKYPLWDFTLVYNFLRDTPGAIEYRTYLGFFGACQGTLNGFSLNDPDDNLATDQQFAVTDGTNTTFGPLLRSYGANGHYITEPVGFIDLNTQFTLFVDDNSVDPEDPTYGYTLNTTTPVNMTVTFKSTPTAGHVLKASFGFYYYCRFGDDTLEFEKFLHQIYKVKQVKLSSLRGP